MSKLDHAKLNRSRLGGTQARPTGRIAARNEGFPTDSERDTAERQQCVEVAARRRRLHLIADAAKKLQR